MSVDDEENEEDAYNISESFAYQQLFNHIRQELIAKHHIEQMKNLTEKLASYMHADGVTDIKVHTKKHIRRRLETEFGPCLKIICGNNNRLLVIPDNITFE